MTEVRAQYDNVRVEVSGKVWTIVLDRDEQRNALNSAMCEQIAATIAEASELALASDEVRVIVIRGEGKAFCAGADLGSSKPAAGESAGGVYGGNFHEALWSMLRACVNAPLLVVANVQGPAVGAGSQLSLACDLRIVGERAWFGVPAASLGFALDAWTINRAKDLLGGALARNVLIGAQRATADQAVASGFAIAKASGEEADAVIEGLAGLAPMSVAQLKSVLNAKDSTYELTPVQEQEYDACWASEDSAEAKLARREKRAPSFSRR